ncbi:MAG: hypothetical protein UY40_C0006G0015 [candidate division CPR1 bacterium GW2011_GWC1_49_13]|uniref:Uncharacterized protein n=1 Tax=candidate division CPR1 bacterium GW2011_GWC1_49_13 TaxID=1618342 RepID=A0A0G1VHI7_9BACT|nr:MAG: hypothetical protein UY40_C0006G0015 [candidate division CPR1 bacterium GW2011_GWC1_49_13]
MVIKNPIFRFMAGCILLVIIFVAIGWLFAAFRFVSESAQQLFTVGQWENITLLSFIFLLLGYFAWNLGNAFFRPRSK